jgi:hypothetical protein
MIGSPNIAGYDALQRLARTQDDLQERAAEALSSVPSWLGKGLRQLREPELTETAAHWVTAPNINHLNNMKISFLLRLLDVRASVS